MAGFSYSDWFKNSLQDNVTNILASGLHMHLFKNSLTLNGTEVLGSFTEATFTGYAVVTLSGFAAAAISGTQAYSTGSVATFTLTAGSQNIYGYYVTDAADSKLYWAENDPNAPIALNTTDNTYQITPKVQRTTQ